MSWPKHTFRGVEYEFGHLKPFPLPVAGQRVLVKFGAHVFCKEFQAIDPTDFVFMDGKTKRTFCPVRHGLSLSLGPTIVAASAGYVYEGGQGKFLFKQALPPPQGFYLIAFQMWQNTSPHYEVTLQLNSAHTRQFIKNSRFAKFADAVAAIANGQPIPWIKK